MSIVEQKSICLEERFAWFYFMNPSWAIKQLKQRTTYARQWARILFPHVRHSVGFIGSTMGIINWTIYLSLWKTGRSRFESIKRTHWRWSSVDNTLFSRATWMLSYYSGNTFERIRKDVEIYGLNTSWIIGLSTSTPAWYLYGFTHISS